MPVSFQAYLSGDYLTESRKSPTSSTLSTKWRTLLRSETALTTEISLHSVNSYLMYSVYVT